MTSVWVLTFFSGFLLFVLPWPCRANSVCHSLIFKQYKREVGPRYCTDFDSPKALQSQTEGHQKMEKRSVLTFPPESVLQINAGLALAGHLERNSAVVVLALQQNAQMPNESLPFLSPSVVVAARQFSIFDHLRDVIASYGFNGAECLRKMVCQIGEAPLLEGLVEDVITFALSPSKHRSVQFRPQGMEWNYLDSLLESERLGKLGGNCSSAYPKCAKTPLDFISTLIHV